MDRSGCVWLKTVLCLVALLVMAGCNQPEKQGQLRPTTKKRGTTGVQGAFEVLFEDVPIPPTLKLVEHESFLVNRQAPASNRGQIRSLAAKYTGHADMANLVRFFMDEMPKRKWEPISRQAWGKTTHMDFRKEGENCHILIRKTWWHVVVLIRLY